MGDRAVGREQGCRNVLAAQVLSKSINDTTEGSGDYANVEHSRRVGTTDDPIPQSTQRILEKRVKG